MDWPDRRVRTNFLYLDTQDMADIAVLASNAGDQPKHQFRLDADDPEWHEYIFQRGLFFSYLLVFLSLH